jgi:phosphoribosylformylglycinamidine cyclo-ligase
MQRLGNVEDKEMFRTFNMGIGMVVICSPDDRQRITSALGGEVFEIGNVVAGDETVEIK